MDIEREKEKFDSLITWYKLQRDDVPALGTSSVGNSTAPSYVSEKGSTTPMSSQPSSHQSGTSSTNGAHGGLNGFSCSPFGLENNPRSNDPMQCMSSPVELDEICPTLEDFMSSAASSSTPSTSSAPQMNQNQNTHPNSINHHHQPDTSLLMLNNHHSSPLNQLSFNHQMPSTSNSNPPSNASLKRRATEEFGNDGPMKQAKIEGSENDNNPMRKLEMMANSSNFRGGNTINEVVEASKKDERTLKMEKLDVIGKSVGEEFAQQAREAQMRQMQQAAAAAGSMPPSYPSPGQYPGPMHYPGMPPMMPPGAPFSAGASYPPMGGPFPPNPYGMHPGMTPGGYPMSAPGKMPFGSPSFPQSAPSPAAMAAMQQGRMPGPPMPPHMMTPQQQQHFMQMQQAQMAHFNAQKAAAAAAAAGMSPAARASPMGASPSPHHPHPSQFPPNHPANPMYHHHIMMMRAMHAQGGQPGHPGMMPPGMMPPGMMPPGMMPPGMHPGMAGMPPMHPGMQGMPPMHPGMQGMPGMPHGPPQPPQNPALMVAGNRAGSAEAAAAQMGNPHHPMMGANMWQLTPHYPPPLPASSSSGAGTPVSR